MNSNDDIEFWINKNTPINFLHLLEQSIKTDENLRDALKLCVNGEAQPFKLFFSKQIEVSYSRLRMPKIFKNEIEMNKMGIDKRDSIATTLNNSQKVISFSYVVQTENGKEKLYANISIMHDFRALQLIKNYMPDLYMKINKLAPLSEAGKYYLLDSMSGF